MKECKHYTFDGWKIYPETYGFYCVNDRYLLLFQAEYRNGQYFQVKSYHDKTTNRTYTAQRYLHKFIPVVNEMAYEMLKNDELWDYNNQCPALDTYKKDIEPYYRKCKEMGLSTSEFLENLFA